MFRPLLRYQLVIDIVGAVLFFLFAGALSLGYGATGSLVLDRLGPDLATAVAIALAALFSGALAVRRLSPTLALVGVWVGAIVQMLCGLPPLPANLAIFGVLYTTAAYGTRAVFWAGLASAGVGAVLISAYLILPTVASQGWSLSAALAYLPVALPLFFAAVFALALAWVIGALVRTGLRARENRVAQERAEADAAAEQERVRIARDMHDVVAHSLAVVIAQADGARYAAATDPEATTRALGTISGTARAALSDVRLLLTQLRHAQTDGPQPTIADLEALYAQVRAAGVDLRVDVDPTPLGEPPAAVQLAVYRILQEALTNALRHGGPGPVRLRLAWHPDRVEIDARNPLSAERRPPASGHGIVGMGERAALVGGSLTAAPDGDDFAVVAVLPIRGAA